MIYTAEHYDLINTTTDDLLMGNVELAPLQAHKMRELMRKDIVLICTEANLKNVRAFFNAVKECCVKHLKAI